VADAAAAREQAREILSQRRYHDTEVPRPFKGPLGWAGDRLQDVGHWFAGLFDDVDGALPGGALVVWLLIAAIVVALAVVVARAAIRRRVARVHAPRASAAPTDDPRALEREADAAERAGEWERAVRLRFRAGALRLAAQAKTTGDIAAELGSPEFERFGAGFDAIAYGGREAAEDDARASRETWAKVLR
jgi:hypothetical protein